MKQLIVLKKGNLKYIRLYGEDFELIEPVEEAKVEKPKSKSQAKRVAELKKTIMGCRVFKKVRTPFPCLVGGRNESTS